MSKSNSQEGIIEFKQSLFAMTGSATIIAQLKQTDKEETSVDIVVQKKGQFLDPLGMCYRVFKKLDKAWQKTLKDQ